MTWLVSSYIDSLSLHKLFACHAFGSFGKILLSLCVCVLYIHWLSVWSLLCSQSESLCCVLWALVSVKTHWWFKESCGSLYYNDWNKAAQLPVKFQELELRKVKWKDKKIEIIQEKVSFSSKSPSTYCRNIHFQTVLSCFVMNNVQQPTMCKENGWWLSVQQRSRVFRTSPTVWWH